MSRLVGAPPGYIGYDEGGQLTESVRRKPYSVVLLDEIEKAHPDVFNILLQVLDEGRLTDNKGRIANFKNTIIIMTSNAGSQVIQDNFEGFEKKDIFDQLDIVDKTKTQVLEHLKRNVRPEFLNRIDEIIMFRPLTKVQIRKIVDIQFRGIQKRLTEAGITIEANKEALDYMGEKGYDTVFGARPLKRVMQQLLLNTLSKEILAGNVRKDAIINVTLDAEGKIAFENIEEVLV